MSWLDSSPSNVKGSTKRTRNTRTYPALQETVSSGATSGLFINSETKTGKKNISFPLVADALHLGIKVVPE